MKWEVYITGIYIPLRPCAPKCSGKCILLVCIPLYALVRPKMLWKVYITGMYTPLRPSTPQNVVGSVYYWYVYPFTPL